MAKVKESSLDVFGKFVMQNLRDRGIDDFEGLLAAHWKAPARQQLQRELADLTEAQRALVRRAFIAAFDSAIHDFLFALQDQSDFEGPIGVHVDGEDVASSSDGLHGELFTHEGWFARFSKYGEPPDRS